MARADRLIWIDLEMTGLVPESDRIIEIATVVTDTGELTAAGTIFGNQFLRLVKLGDFRGADAATPNEEEAAAVVRDGGRRGGPERSGQDARLLAGAGQRNPGSPRPAPRLRKILGPAIERDQDEIPCIRAGLDQAGANTRSGRDRRGL